MYNYLRFVSTHRLSQMIKKQHKKEYGYVEFIVLVIILLSVTLAGGLTSSNTDSSFSIGISPTPGIGNGGGPNFSTFFTNLFSPPTIQKKFTTLPPGSSLPSDNDCVAQITRTATVEPRPDNVNANNTNVYTKGYRIQPSADPTMQFVPRVTGNFTGKTDEIIQWSACKWGFDEDMIRAQAVVDSNWHQSTFADCQGSSIPQTHDCQSFGLLLVKGADNPPTYPGTWPYAYQSTSFNTDYALAITRACFEGKLQQSNYESGDLLGCMALRFTGTWHDAKAEDYITKVQNAYKQKPWISPNF